MNDKKKYLRWMEMLREQNRSISREEKRKEEVLEIFKALTELSKHRVEAPYLLPWEPTW
jgi:uncharacterized linocin/CFP29 family protein